MTSVAIGVIGDFDSNFAPHQLTSASLKNAASALRTSVEIEWLPTENSHDYSRFSAGLVQRFTDLPINDTVLFTEGKSEWKRPYRQ